MFENPTFSMCFGLVAGLAIGILGNLILIYRQFKNAVAGYRIRQIAEATKYFVETPKKKVNTGFLRDKYRYSLGLVIDELSSNNSDFLEDKWPLLVGERDRWERFNEYVRPAMDDLDTYAFLGAYSILGFYDLRQLNLIIKLYRQLETLVGLLDGAYEIGSIEIINGSRVTPTKDTNGPLIEEIRREYKNLFKLWDDWLKLNNINRIIEAKPDE